MGGRRGEPRTVHAEVGLVLDVREVRGVLSGAKTQMRLPLRGAMPTPPAHDSVRPGRVPRHAAPYFDAYRGERRTDANPEGMSSRWCWWTRDDRQRPPTVDVGFQPGTCILVREAARIAYAGWHHLEGQSHEVAYAADMDGLTYAGNGHRACGGGIRRGEAPGLLARRSHRVDGSLRHCSPAAMPRWASRLTLVVTRVRVERLQAIDEAGATAEGVLRRDRRTALECGTALERFVDVWDARRPATPWADDPWVVALTFRTERRNIDAAEDARGTLAA